jgi:Holliday junction resolvasome RuvABC endonuclease subunit
MNVLIVDPANSTGYCVISIIDNKAEIFEYGFIDIEDKEYVGDQYIQLSKEIEDLIKKYDIKEIAIEDYFFSGKFAQGTNLNGAYRAIIHMKSRELGLPYTILNISLWKKFINGRTTPTKEQKLQWGKDPAKKLMTQESLWKRWGIRFPNHCISNNTGKPIMFRFDIVDAVAMGIFFLCIHKNIQNWTYTVKKLEDVEFKRESKKIFNYE